MAKYTIDLYSLLKDNNFKLFNFDYDFYTSDPVIKQSFESKFMDRYLFHEIGFETVARFKHYLKQRLNNIAPYYKQLYETEVRSKELDFMLNKDLTETFERLIEGENNSSQVATGKTISSNSSNIDSNNTLNSNTNTNTNTNSSNKESYLEQGLANVDISDSLTGVTANNESLTNTDNTNAEGITKTTTNDNSNIDNNSSTSTSNKTSNKEVTKLVSQGNIGVTSSAELLEKWRRVLINIDNLIIEDCKDLFMQIY